MQPKLFLMLAIVVLLAALLGGNPFLNRGGAGFSPAVPLHAPAPGFPAAGDGLLVGMGSTKPTGKVAIDWNEGRPIPAASFVDANRTHGQAVPVGAALHDQPREAGVVTPCPDPVLRPLVIDVEIDASGAPIWVLRDGTRLRRNPIAGKEPLLVPVPSASGKPERP